MSYPYIDKDGKRVNGPFAENRFNGTHITLTMWHSKPIVLNETRISNNNGFEIVELKNEETGEKATFEKKTFFPWKR